MPKHPVSGPYELTSDVPDLTVTRTSVRLHGKK
ncbi:hypothetical protein SRB5_39750 [Streptomyces sp. RB5]|uniref:Uncharacterized protein n=1 Tax=Streptomyces smaragdinus TaxID=2585196 RepID=A0A7K0CK01_9ACTN|nr:hypothetical protein [Streptomyces smaragdinus]